MIMVAGKFPFLFIVMFGKLASENVIDCLSISAVLGVLRAGSDPLSIQMFASLFCDIFKFNASLDNVETRWRLPDDGGFVTSDDQGRFNVLTQPDLMNRNRTNLVITSLSYQDNGTYACEVRQAGSSDEWVSANIDLVLLVHLTAGNDSVSTYDNSTSVELTCDMAGFIPDISALKWYMDNQLVSVDDPRITVSYGDGSRESQRGFAAINSSVESTLRFSPPMTTDSGTYECRITGFEFLPVQNIELSVQTVNSSMQGLLFSSTVTNGLTSVFTSNDLISSGVITSSDAKLSVATIIGISFAGVVVLTVSFVLIVLLTVSGLFYAKRQKMNKPTIKNELETAVYVDVDAEIQKNLEDRFDNSLIDKTRLELVEKLGEGEFGVVFHGLLTAGQSASTISVAVKTLKGSFNQSNIDSIINEALTMKSFNHRNILPLIGVCLDLNEAPCIVMPYMNEGSLLSYLRREKAYLTVSTLADDTVISETTKKLLSICLQVANGMAYLADQKFVHRDLAARNCMVSSDGFIKVGDFGLSEDIYESEYFRQTQKSAGQNVKLPIKWMAIESIHYKIFNEKTDVWSYGVLCWEVFSAGSTPYSNMSPKDVMRNLNEGYRLEKPTNAACSEDIYCLMMSCWNESSDKRPSFSETVNKLEYLIAPLAQYMDFTELYVTMKQ